jgi:hypothetical protein
MEWLNSNGVPSPRLRPVHGRTARRRGDPVFSPCDVEYLPQVTSLDGPTLNGAHKCEPTAS